MHIVDAHHHVWDLNVRDQPWISGPAMAPLRRSFPAAEFAHEARAASVRASVLVQTVTEAQETPELLALAADSDLIAAVVGWTDLTAPGVGEELSRLRGLPGGESLRGIRHQVQGEPDPEWLVRPDVLRGLRAVAARGLAYDLVVLPHQLPAAARAAAAVPELTFVLDHLGKPPLATGVTEAWEAGLRGLAALPNTVAKLSGLVTEADWETWSVDQLRGCVDAALDAFGPERVMFGSDWPVCTLAARYADVMATTRTLTAALGPSEQTQVWSGTAARTYGLGTPPSAG
ncbi:amidohydrolase family protein [Streptomyces reniochalinae]|uniref:Amidohydrolase n=1 Tax=Streptomyces reniochalinae TaxID=2250578 RepID=A0A367EIG0_9ACTN|nr:amidohydrolase family protein [Streptomyces reniochalinae]RCG17425.1 amidohydrolase [Streptomyces reniochalinae]